MKENEKKSVDGEVDSGISSVKNVLINFLFVGILEF